MFDSTISTIKEYDRIDFILFTAVGCSTCIVVLLLLLVVSFHHQFDAICRFMNGHIDDDDDGGRSTGI